MESATVKHSSARSIPADAAGRASGELTRLLGFNAPLVAERGYHVMLQPDNVQFDLPVTPAARASSRPKRRQGIGPSGTGCTGMVIAAGYSFTVSYAIFRFINFLMPIRVSSEEEEIGLDASQHDEKYMQGTLLVHNNGAIEEKQAH